MNRKWNYVDLTRFTNGGHYDFVMNIIAEAKKIEILNEKCGPELAAMQAAVTEEGKVMLPILNEPELTKNLWEQDGIRDRRYVNVSEITRAMTKFPEAMAQKAAADKVLAVLKRYKLNTQAQVNKETGVMTNLLQELQGDFAADIATLGLTSIVTDMAAANAEVIRIYNDRLWADSEKVAAAVANARAEADRCYAALREKVNALVVVFGPEDYSAFIGYANQRILEAKRRQLAPKRMKGEGAGTGSEEEVEEEEVEEETETEETEEEQKPGAGDEKPGESTPPADENKPGEGENTGSGNKPGSGSSGNKDEDYGII